MGLLFGNTIGVAGSSFFGQFAGRKQSSAEVGATRVMEMRIISNWALSKFRCRPARRREGFIYSLLFNQNACGGF